MERYHIFKLGLAITFYAAYCVRPMLVYSLEADNELENNQNLPSELEYFQYFHGVDGKPGIDFPIYSYIPRTAFSCLDLESGYYADLETDCQVFHICEEGRKISFLCPNGTIFQQSELICEWWNKVNCSDSPSFYGESAEKLKYDSARRKSNRRVPSFSGNEINHGAIMRTEEKASVSIKQNGKDYFAQQQNQNQQRIKNHRIPENNDIEQHIEESNNRYLANSQKISSTLKKDAANISDKKHPNHNYNDVSISVTNTYSSTNFEVSKNNANKNINDQETDNFNRNSDQSTYRHSKKVDLGNRNNFGNSYDFSEKNSFPKSSTLKEYHVEFASTSTGVDSTTQKLTSTYVNYGSYNTGTTVNGISKSSSSSTVLSNSVSPQNRPQYELKTVKEEISITTRKPVENIEPFVFHNNDFGKKTSTVTTKTYYKEENKDISYESSTPIPERVTLKPKSTTNFRGSVKYNGKVNTQKQQAQSVPVTTYSPPYNYFGSTQQNDNQFATKDNQKVVVANNYELPPFPKHRSEFRSQETTVTAQNNFALGPKATSPLPQLVTSTETTNVGSQIKVDILKPPKESYSNYFSENQKDYNSVYKNVENTDHKFQDSGETQVPQESSSFVRSPFNSISNDHKASTNSYPNHRSTYSDTKDQSYLEAPKASTINSITPHLITTQPINNGKPFVGSRVGTTLLPISQPTTQSKYTYLPTSSKPTVIFGVLRHSSTTEPSPFGPPELFNTGRTDKTLPPKVATSIKTTNSIPTERFNVGNTDTTIQYNIIPSFGTTTFKPLNIAVPEHGSLNYGKSEPEIGTEPKIAKEIPFTKKTASLLYPKGNFEKTTDHAIIYGSYVSSTTKRQFGSSSNTPYSPTVPTVTQSSPIFGSTAKSQGIPIKFAKGQDKISVRLSNSLSNGQSQVRDQLSSVQPANQKVNTIIRFDGGQGSVVSSTPTTHSTDLYGTKPLKSKIEKPRPFTKTLDFDNANSGNGLENGNASPFPTYQTSSARPFSFSQSTQATPTKLLSNSFPAFKSYDNVDNMISVLQEIAKFNSDKKGFDATRPGLVIPPSVGPQTLHSLAQYFANELQNPNVTEEVLDSDTKEKLTSLLTQMTVHGYNHLFKNGVTKTPTESSTSKSSTPVSTETRIGEKETKNKDSGDDLLSTTSLPELRHLAKNFSLALSSFLHDPENFRKNLEGLRPTEPPLLDGVDNTETNDEILKFSDADIKPSTLSPNPSPTWGYILADEITKDTIGDVKNSLNPDLHTADSQSFIPRFNNLAVNEKEGKNAVSLKGITGKGVTSLPENHWTSSPAATKLWQKALSVNPAVVNNHFETTPPSSFSLTDETTEPELYHQEVLPTLNEPSSEISYDLRQLPPLQLNSTQVHGILIDFMNHTKSDENSRLYRILKKLNTTQEEFLDRMKEIESNPLTKRLVLLLISECGANIANDLAENDQGTLHGSSETSSSFETKSRLASRNAKSGIENSSFRILVHPSLSEEDQDARALQLLNSLYTIASRFGKKR